MTARQAGSRHVPRHLALQDPTSHPAWTGEDVGISVEDARMARLLERYGESIKSPAQKAREAAAAAEAAAQASTA